MSILRKLRSRRGSIYIEALVGIMMLMTIVAFALEIYGTYMIKQNIEKVAGETARYIELRGALNSDVYSEFDRLSSVMGLDAELTVDGDFTSSGKLQLEAPFTVSVFAHGRIFHIGVPLIAKATGRSEVYWK